MNFEKIKTINVKNKPSWDGKLFLTFDVDWCSDEVLSYTLDIVEKYDINSTFFITHQTALLDRMRENPKIELGIHPNFNPLLNKLAAKPLVSPVIPPPIDITQSSLEKFLFSKISKILFTLPKFLFISLALKK